jgi:hypothetical protein
VRGIFYFLFAAILAHPLALPANMGQLAIGGSNVLPGPVPLPSACELVEQALMMQVQMAGGGQMGVNMDMQIRIARAYRELARRGCLQNRTQYAIHYRAAVEVAWALLDIQYPMPDTIETDANGVVTDGRVLERRRLAAELREIERAPASQGW